MDRIARLRPALRSAALDALLVTHAPNIRYLTGLYASTATAVVTENGIVLIVDSRYASTAQEIADAHGFELRVARGSLDEAAAAELSKAGAKRVGVEGEHLPLNRHRRLTDQLAHLCAGEVPFLVGTEGLVERLREVKDEQEIETLREAGRRISAVAREARRWVVPGASELDVAAAVDAAMRGAGFERPAFDTIVASGPNGARPHARPGRRKLAEGDGVVLDFGGVYDGYCVDLTRTLQLGEVPARFRRMFDAVRQARAAAIAAVAPGAAATDIDNAARRVLEAHGLGDAFGHGTGHGLGIEVHEEPRISRTAPAGATVVAGMVFTIEPGAYVPGVGGVRIEDDVLVVEGGCELLTDVPLEL